MAKFTQPKTLKCIELLQSCRGRPTTSTHTGRACWKYERPGTSTCAARKACPIESTPTTSPEPKAPYLSHGHIDCSGISSHSVCYWFLHRHSKPDRWNIHFSSRTNGHEHRRALYQVVRRKRKTHLRFHGGSSDETPRELWAIELCKRGSWSFPLH